MVVVFVFFCRVCVGPTVERWGVEHGSHSLERAGSNAASCPSEDAHEALFIVRVGEALVAFSIMAKNCVSK